MFRKKSQQDRIGSLYCQIQLGEFRSPSFPQEPLVSCLEKHLRDTKQCSRFESLASGHFSTVGWELDPNGKLQWEKPLSQRLGAN